MTLVVARRVMGSFAGKDEIGVPADVAATREIAGAVNEVARQALEATIEAARAGAAGRRFAVAASEVRQLATQGAKVIDEISAQIAGMQAGTQEPVRAFREISGAIGRLSEAATRGAAAVGEQGARQEASRIVTQAAQDTTQAGPVRAA